MSATPKAAYLWFALLIDHGVSYVRLNKSQESFKVTLTKAILFFLKQLWCQPQTSKKKDLRSELDERRYYAKRMMMI